MTEDNESMLPPAAPAAAFPTEQVPAEKPYSIYAAFETDRRMEEDGIIVDYGPAGRFRVSRASDTNRRFMKATEKIMRPHRRRVANEDITPAEMRALSREVFVDGILIGWEGVAGRDGKPLPYSRENALRLMDDLPDLMTDLMEQAQKANNFRRAGLEADAGN